jgi:hypothetical protein
VWLEHADHLARAKVAGQRHAWPGVR